jgi:hypothetical protein
MNICFKKQAAIDQAIDLKKKMINEERKKEKELEKKVYLLNLSS